MRLNLEKIEETILFLEAKKICSDQINAIKKFHKLANTTRVYQILLACSSSLLLRGIEVDEEKLERLAKGIAKTYYPNGHIHKVTLYKNGKKHGKSLILYPDGKPFKSINYSQGVIHGERRRYSPNGFLVEIATFKRGILHGPSIRFNSQGREIEKKFYWNGSPCSKFKFKILSIFWR